jgi:hypothetical protein
MPSTFRYRVLHAMLSMFRAIGAGDLRFDFTSAKTSTLHHVAYIMRNLMSRVSGSSGC